MCTVEAEKNYILERTCKALIFRYNFTIYLSAKCWVLLRVDVPYFTYPTPYISCTNSTQYLHQFNTIQMSTELFLTFAHHRSFSLPRREASSAHTNCSVWYEVQKCPSPNPLQLTQKRASWLHFTEQQSFSPSLLSSPLLSSPLLSSPLLSSPLLSIFILLKE